jgi:glycerophosphoryl diester phosphodiesterase
MAISFLRIGGLLLIGYGAAESRRVKFFHALLITLRRAVPVVVLSLAVLALLTLVLLPFLGVALWVASRLLSQHDINYYLEFQPTEFWMAVGVGGLLAITVVGLSAFIVLRLLFSLPNLLLLRLRVLTALRRSLQQTRGKWLRIAALLLIWAVIWFLVFALVNWALHGLGEKLVAMTAERVRLLVLALGGITALSLIINFLLGFLSESTACLLVVRLFRRAGGSATQLPSSQALDEMAGDGISWSVLRKAPLTVAILGLILAVLVVRSLLEQVRWDDRIEISAHRGSSLAAPENTLSAVRQAIDDGATYVEIDVQRTADGVLVITHDADLMRVGGKPLVISESRYEELAKVDVGSRHGAAFADERVPTLEQVIDEVEGRIKLIVELKSYKGDKQKLVSDVVQMLRDKKLGKNAVVMSLAYDELVQLNRLAPEMTVGFVASASLGDLTTLDVDFLAVSQSQATDLLISSAHSRNKQVYVWTVDDPSTASLMIDRGADNLITNDPATIVRVLQDRQALSNAERILLRFRSLYLD